MSTPNITNQTNPDNPTANAIPLPAGIDAKLANGKNVRFELTTVEGIGRLHIWESPNKPGNYRVNIEIPETLGPPGKPTFKFTTLDLPQQYAAMLRKHPLDRLTNTSFLLQESRSPLGRRINHEEEKTQQAKND